ncbi:CNH domain-containing protein [Cunninghamella echinulata]|nr:CNH domain-containing protein [Cunninghamella echinulata]
MPGPYYNNNNNNADLGSSSLPMPQASTSSTLQMPLPNNNNYSDSVSHVYPPPSYQAHRSPPGSPGSRYTIVNDHQQSTATNSISNNNSNNQSYPPANYTRPLSQDYISTFRQPHIRQSSSIVSTPSSETAPGSSPSSSSQQHRRTNSSLRNLMHNTIERPRYTRPTPINTSSSNSDQNDEIPFVPVSPDTSDEDEDYSPTPIERQKQFERQQAALQKQMELQQQQQKAPPKAPEHSSSIIVEPNVLKPNARHESMLSTSSTLVENITPNFASTSMTTTTTTATATTTTTEDVITTATPAPVPNNNNTKPRPTSISVDMDRSILSDLSKTFIRRIKALEHVRELFCANEYPESFTGQEAVTVLHSILDEKIPEAYCIKIANALMHSRPGLFEPVHYSQKSLITGTVYNSPDELYTFDEDATADDIPRGVFTSLTKCYTYGCKPEDNGCYAPMCPNKPEIFKQEFLTESSLSRQTSIKSTVSDNEKTSYPHKAWAERVPRELFEIPLLESNIIEAQKRREFVKEVFNNYYELRDISTALFKDLFELQRRYDQKCLPSIGDVMLQHFPFFERPFTTYCPRVPLAEYIVATESQANPKLSQFINELSKDSRFRRLAFRHFLLNPVSRMQRYKLLLGAVLKKTDEDHPDHAYLERCIEMINEVAKKADNATAAYHKRVEILQIDDSLIYKQGEIYELQLGDVHRKLYHKGELKRKPNTTDVSDKSDIHAFVFDHVLLMTKHRKSTTGEEYRVWKRPIPLQMIFIQGPGDGMLRTPTNGLNAGNLQNAYGAGGTFPLTLYHLGQRGGVYTFFCNSLEEKLTWVKAIEEAKAALKRRQGENDVFELRTLDDSSFRYLSTANGANGQGRVTCSVPFVTIDREYKVAIGTDAGVYFKTVNKNDLRRVINCENVTQLAVMDKHHILLVLADKTLKAYPIDTLNSPTNIRAPERLSQELAQHVSFFHVGYCNNKDLLIYKKKKNASSVFSALEPICDLRDPRNERLLTQRTGFLGQRSNQSWFKKYKDFYVGAEATNLHFLKSKLNVVCERGFEIIDPENLSVSRDIPDQEDPQFNFVQRQTEPLKPLAMYRIQDKFLLCYNKFAFYVNNRNGSLVMRGNGRSPLLCEWEGNPDHIVYQHPYILAFSSQFIEVRHVDTGELVQVIPGDNIRLTYYNGGGDMPIIHVCMTHNQKQDTQHVFNLWLDPQRSSNSNRYPRQAS